MMIFLYLGFDLNLDLSYLRNVIIFVGMNFILRENLNSHQH